MIGHKAARFTSDKLLYRNQNQQPPVLLNYSWTCWPSDPRRVLQLSTATFFDLRFDMKTILRFWKESEMSRVGDNPYR